MANIMMKRSLPTVMLAVFAWPPPVGSPLVTTSVVTRVVIIVAVVDCHGTPHLDDSTQRVRARRVGQLVRHASNQAVWIHEQQ